METDNAYPKEAYQKGDYILNHYARNSHADKIILARDLHKWALKYSAKQYNRRTTSGNSWNVRVGYKIVGFGLWIAGVRDI